MASTPWQFINGAVFTFSMYWVDAIILGDLFNSLWIDWDARVAIFLR